MLSGASASNSAMSLRMRSGPLQRAITSRQISGQQNVQPREAIARQDETSVWLTGEIFQCSFNFRRCSNWQSSRLHVEHQSGILNRRHPKS
jgi:hypothetical protein